MSRRTEWIISISVAVLALVISVIVMLTKSDEHTTQKPATPPTVTTKVDGSGAAGVQKQTVVAPKHVVNEIKPNLERDLRNKPQGMSQAQVKAVEKAAAQIKATLPGLPTAGATAEYPGCRTEFISSFSSRHGVRPTEFTLHYTVSPNVVGWGDVNAVVNLFAHEQASSNFVLDGEGHCAYIVPIEQKAWTQAGGNPFSVSVEVIDTGKETTYLPSAGMKQLASIIRTVSARTGIPIRAGSVSSNCVPIRSGIIQHKDWGICGGGHFDISPFAVPPVIKYVQATTKPSKKSIWVKHRQAVHVQYQKDCKTAAQRKQNAKECAALRVRARALDKLIARK